jgi:hypothetical protein
VGAGGVTYLATIWWVHRGRAMAVWTAIRTLRHPASGGHAGA